MTTPYGTAPGATGDGDPNVTDGADYRRPYSTAPEWSGPSGYTGIPRPAGTGVRTGRRWRRKHTLGCFGTLIAAVVFVVLLQVLFTPWAMHIGDSFTPLMSWSGVAEGRSATGSSYAVQLNISANNLSQHSCSGVGGCDDFHGTIVVCTAAGQYTMGNVSGKVGGWLSTNGQQMSVSFSGRRNTPTQYLLGNLHGTWHGKVYQATDGGYLDRNFKPDGTPRTVFSTVDANDTTSLAFRPGNFDTACAQVKRG
jgi:hypothetical protein